MPPLEVFPVCHRQCSLYATVRGVPCVPPLEVFPVCHRQRCSLYATVRSVPCMPPSGIPLYAMPLVRVTVFVLYSNVSDSAYL